MSVPHTGGEAASIIDSRRLTGPNLYSVRPGAVLEVRCTEAQRDELCARWLARARELADTLGWPDGEALARPDRDGATLFLIAPVDQLMTATEVNEVAWASAEADSRSVTDAVERLRAMAEEERESHPNLADVYAAALARGISVTFDDEELTIGSGVGGWTWTFDEVPLPDEIAWSDAGDVPTALVTGSNGKTTTTRLVAAMCRQIGKVAGLSCSDGVWIDTDQVESGDYSGPAGARMVLRDPRVDVAVLETARGGILRRGLGTTRADVAIITNVSADHFGEYGIDSMEELVETKATLARVLSDDGTLVLNADDALLVSLGARVTAATAWFSMTGGHAELDAHIARGGDAATVQEGRVILNGAGRRHDLGAVVDMPITLGGAAPHNIANVLGAVLVAAALGVTTDAMRDTLASFGTAADDNPGRLQVYKVRGVTALVDYAHNPGGLEALCRTAQLLPARRRLLLLGQAGNRGDDQIRLLPRVALGITAFDHIIVKDMPALLRGRKPGEVPRVIVSELEAMGFPGEAIEVVDGEADAVRRAFAWADEGDLLVLPVHAEKDAVLRVLADLY